MSEEYIAKNDSIYKQIKEYISNQDSLTIELFKTNFGIPNDTNRFLNDLLGNVYINNQFERNLEFDLHQYHINLNSRKCFLLNKLTLLSDSNLVFYIKHENGINIEYWLYDSVSVDNLKSRQQRRLGKAEINADIQLPLKEYVFGEFCSVGGTPPQECKQMLQMVNNKNVSGLIGWLKSSNPEISAYGYEGLFFLSEFKGVILKPQIEEYMQSIITMDRLIIRCEGCNYAMMERTSVILNHDQLRRNYLTFKGTGYLK